MFAVLGFAITVLPIGYFHEIGHKVICETYGGTAKVGPPTNTGIDAICLNSKSDVRLMRFFGGFFGTIGALSPLVVYTRFKTKPFYKGFLIACLGQAVAEFPKSFLEAFYYDFYASETGGILFLALTLVGWVGFFLILGRKKALSSTSDI
ncbi:hypothetical protein NVIE_006520 [Nitrososphaera viennensis EN76]|mgnify:CR=1 FL=1|uniref:DUF3267 domain-containing protein n=2 Tax=Nitrososphaera viennensis TaxID=1034015 RepID=A0A060HMQ4_9ARCH|nr:hypothetical protein NVIE_006520 [Nitrososphaera viennensis EN76]